MKSFGVFAVVLASCFLGAGARRSKPPTRPALIAVASREVQPVAFQEGQSEIGTDDEASEAVQSAYGEKQGEIGTVDEASEAVQSVYTGKQSEIGTAGEASEAVQNTDTEKVSKIGIAGQASETLQSASSEKEGQQGESAMHPAVADVLRLLRMLGQQIDHDGMEEEKSYAKFEQWCHESIYHKEEEINGERKAIKEGLGEVEKLMGKEAEEEATMKQLKHDLDLDLEAREDATVVRGKEAQDFRADETELRQSIEALEAALKVLTSSRSGALLSTMQEAQLLSSAADINRVLQREEVLQSIPMENIQALQQFLAAPAKVAALQLEGEQERSPKADVIVGIIKQMLQDFRSKLGTERTQETDKIAAFRDLSEAKNAEITSLRQSLKTVTREEASTEQNVADTKHDVHRIEDEEKVDVETLAERRATCRDRAREWDERSRLRHLQLQSFQDAIGILQEAGNTLGKSHEGFLQVGQESKRTRPQAASLRELLLKQGKSASLAQVAAEVSSGKSFNFVLREMDKMIEALREEEKHDIAMRDDCQRQKVDSNSHNEDMQDRQSKTVGELNNLARKSANLEMKVRGLEHTIEDMKRDLQRMLDMRVDEQRQLQQAIQDDHEAISAIAKAIEVLEAFLRRNHVESSSLLQHNRTHGSDDPPKLKWVGDQFHKGGHNDIISILRGISSDMEAEIRVAQKEEEKAMAQYHDERASAEEAYEVMKEGYVSNKEDLAEMRSRMSSLEARLKNTQEDLKQNFEVRKALMQECLWVKSHFDFRRSKRRGELQGLLNARGILKGADVGKYADLDVSIG